MYGIQLAWIPFWAAGVINGLGHWWGYRNFVTEDASTNMTPVAAWIGGEELHNNHHAYPTSAKFSIRWYEFDLGWMYIRILETLGLANVRKRAPKVKLDPSKFEVDAQTLQAVIAHRYDVLANYAKSMKSACALEIATLRAKGHDSSALKALRKWLHQDARDLPEMHREKVDVVLASSPMLKTTASMRQELTRLWERSTLTTEQLVSQLKDWCERAEQSNVPQLVAFSRRLRYYA
jgi:stearoyl-CoA desaturase (delta-9 desaturase)